jgi:2,3-bisphosphoglycerate-dependent phosphoglycerate mutase
MTHRRLFPAAVLCLATLIPSAARAAVFVVRHAEKQSEANDRDVPLSEAGRARAKRLASMLRDAGIVTIYSTDTVRTRTTAEPLASASKISPVLYDSSGPEGLKTLADRILREHRGNNVLVVGHSNTIAPLVEALGCKESVTVGAQEYDGLWIVVPAPAAGGAATLLRLRQ